MRYTEIDGKRYEMDQCFDCPFVFYDYVVPVCNHPDRQRVTDDSIIPEDCPLRSTILEQEDQEWLWQ